jgi:Nuclease-related domain
VRIVELSDHPGDLLEQERQRREDEQERARAQFERRRAKHEARVQRARRARDEARAQRRWLTWLRGILTVRREQREAPREPAPVQVSAQEEILAAGVHGEGIVTSELSRALGDEWTLLRGYHNRLGEIDHLLLGPRGLVAIEVKYRNATVHCDGDTWWYDKYDRAGHLVERGQPMADNRGRSPSLQLNQPAGLLEQFLRTRGHPVTVQRVVLFTHARSRLGTCRNRTVHIATSTGYVLDLLKRLPGHLDPSELGQLERLILRDHNHQSRRR